MIGKGLYTPAEAASLIKAPVTEVKRWAFGYDRRRNGARVHYAPLIHTDLPEIEGQRALTFTELVELMYIKGFRRSGAPWRLIHEAAAVAARMFETEHPFAMRKFFADPSGIYALLEETHGGESLVRLEGHGQHALREVVQPYLGQLEFDPMDVPTRWWPLGKEGRVVVDPHVSFGEPIIAEIGVPTRTLADAFQAEQAYDGERALERVAWLYKVPPRHVQTATRFEEWRLAA
jgi:uncharacterized protein (DUF433 family)